MSNDPNCTNACRLPGGCGDGKIEPPEQCDDGALLNVGDYGGCAPSCIYAPHCGDGLKNGPEECDDGILDGSYGGCTPQCKLATTAPTMATTAYVLRAANSAFVSLRSQVVPNRPPDCGNLIAARVVYGLAPAGNRPASAGDRAERPSGAGAEGMLPCLRQTTPTPTRI